MEKKVNIIEHEFSSKKVFILEDETDISELVSLNLKKAGFKTKEFAKADLFLKYIKEDEPDLLVLDLMLPDIDGLEVCRYLKKNESYSQIPIIMLTAKAEELDKVVGLEIGADDYVTKPFSPRELVARVKAVLRRDTKSTADNKVTIGDFLVIDYQRYEVFVKGIKVELTNSEFKILKLLLTRRGWVYSRNQILDHLDTQDKGTLDRTVDVHIKNLREKLGVVGAFIKNIRGIGYKFDG